MLALRALMKIQIRKGFISTLKRAYQHDRIAAQFYHALSYQMSDGIRRDSILRLANNAERNARHYAVRLSLLNSELSPKDEVWSDRIWYWLLLHWNVNRAIRWIEWTERKDNDDLDSLYSAKELWR